MAKIPDPPAPMGGFEPDPVPLLENGDQLTRAEFERRYAAMPRLKKAELIEGVVYMPSPVSLRKHGRPIYRVIMWLGFYSIETPGLTGAGNATVRLDLDNEPQPDAFLIIDPELGGQAQIDEDDFLVGAPELVVEVAASTSSYDLHQKLAVYRRNGVREYVVWRVNDRKIDWFEWNEGVYDRLEPDAEGCYQSRIFPGLVLDAASIITGDMKRVSEVQKSGLSEAGVSRIRTTIVGSKG